MAAVNSAVTPLLASDWLTVDDTAAERGFGPAEYGDPSTDPSPDVVPDQGSPFTGNAPGAPEGDSLLWSGDGEGAWPFVPAYGSANDYAIQRQQGFPQGELAVPVNNPDAPAPWANEQPLQTYDYLFQHTSTEGWNENVPADRVSSRRTFGQLNPQNNPTWYPYAENHVRTRPARVAAAFTADDAQFGVPSFSTGSLPTWDMSGGQGNTVYETPPAPPVSYASTADSADPAAGWA